MKFLKPIDPAGAVEWNVSYRTRVVAFDEQDEGLTLGHADRANATERNMRLVESKTPFVSLSLVSWLQLGPGSAAAR